MNSHEVRALLDKISRVRVGIVGDFCLDAYLLMEPGASEPSLETGLSTRPVRSQRYSLGGAGNVAENLLAMGVDAVSVFGVTGQDPFGEEMRRLFTARAMNTDGLLIQREQWETHVYMKPYEREQEQHRFDFGVFNQIHPATSQLLLVKLAAALPALDVVIINEQATHGIHSKEFRERLTALIVRHPGTRFIADSRHFPGDYGPALRKVSVEQAADLCGGDSAALDTRGREDVARTLSARWGTTLFMTMGENGCLVSDGERAHEVPGLLILSQVDPVGAGDSMLAGIGAALAAGAEPLHAAEFGSLVAGVTVQKLMQTGTATPEEIMKIGTDPDRRYRPDLARHPGDAVYHDDTEIEIVSGLPRGGGATHVIFDHDGTISTLRQGWEQIMEPMMVRAILGRDEREADPALHDHVVTAVRDYINKTTGIQTLVQMKGLVQLVKRFKCVPESDILDEHGYKAVFNRQLTDMVSARIRKLDGGELSVEDFTVKGAVEFLHALHQMGVRLYLASGTDQEDVEGEARILGYHSLFEERIYGAVGDVTREAKRMVLERILADLAGEPPERILTIGDGPVEIRETHKKGGYTIGVASDEIRRFGLNLAKRGRLIEAGADLIIPDYSQRTQLFPLLFEK
jgi:bifunctional ADP-heptose synthase (sugar kinase/adenylyltransferase)/phosphoglycolate phosphatase-like HAD superfamily hydrolase